MKRRRRLLLQSLAAALAPLPQAAPAATMQAGESGNHWEALRALIDTLIPADETPAASALGIDQALQQIVRNRADYQRLIERGAEWLDRSARALGAKSFAAATEEQRIAVVLQAEQSGPKTVPRTLFEHVRFDALRLYYAQPAVWPALSYTGPPQPAGFLDFERPPSPR